MKSVQLIGNSVVFSNYCKYKIESPIISSFQMYDDNIWPNTQIQVLFQYSLAIYTTLNKNPKVSLFLDSFPINFYCHVLKIIKILTIP